MEAALDGALPVGRPPRARRRGPALPQPAPIPPRARVLRCPRRASAPTTSPRGPARRRLKPARAHRRHRTLNQTRRREWLPKRPPKHRLDAMRVSVTPPTARRSARRERARAAKTSRVVRQLRPSRKRLIGLRIALRDACWWRVRCRQSRAAPFRFRRVDRKFGAERWSGAFDPGQTCEILRIGLVAPHGL